MKIELIRKVEPDNIWFNVWKDGSCVKCFGVHTNNEEDIKNQAEEYFDKLVNQAKGTNEEVIKSIEI